MEPRPDVEALEVHLFLEAVHAQYGYDLRDYTFTSIQRRIRSILAKFGISDIGQLQHQVLTDPAFFVAVLENLTVRTSEMFRDPDFYQTFRTRVVPMLRTYPLLRIWHSGCSTGEEAFTTAIILQEEGLYERSQIYATDLSREAIEIAKQGVYSAERFKIFGDNYKESGGRSNFSDYCTYAYDHIEMKESLRRSILFFQHNLVSDHVFGEMHVIFCRNVLIYFGQDLRKKILAKFAQSLCPAGLLCLGSSERLFPSKAGASNFSEFDAAARIYRFEGMNESPNETR